MIEKIVLDRLLRRVQHGTITMNYWDGTVKSYGNGKPHVPITIKSSKVVRAIMGNISLGVGESYMSGQLDTNNLPGLLQLFIENQSAFTPLKRSFSYKRHKNRRQKQQWQISHHYDIGNDFYRLWLDNETMAYSCAYFKKKTDSLETAQKQKFDHLLRKLQLQRGDTMLDIGCGWGHLLVWAVKHYGASGTGISLSKEQIKYARALAKKEGVADKAHFKLMNYQDLAESGKQFDRVVSVGMFEHVGKGQLVTYYKSVSRLLKPGGISVLHTITNQVEAPRDPWVDKYIFPGGYIPSTREIVAQVPEYDLRMIDYENLRLHYAYTCDEWWRRLESHKDEVIAMFDERFYRMWRFWLAASATAFRYGGLDLSQFVFTKGYNNEIPLTREHMYRSAR